MAAPVVVRHDLGRTVAIVVWVAAIVALAASWPPSWSAALLALGLSGIVWVLAWRPSVMVADDAVTVRNPLRDVRIAWPALDDAGFDWALWLRAGNVTCRAAAAPGPASMGALYDRGRSKTGIYERHAVKTVGHSLPPALFAVRQRWVGQTHDGPADVHVTRPWVSIIMLTVSIIVVAGAGLLA